MGYEGRELLYLVEREWTKPVALPEKVPFVVRH